MYIYYLIQIIKNTNIGLFLEIKILKKYMSVCCKKYFEIKIVKKINGFELFLEIEILKKYMSL